MYELRARDEFDSLGRTSQEEGGGPPPKTSISGGKPLFLTCSSQSSKFLFALFGLKKRGRR
jgi:hypothetical protein